MQQQLQQANDTDTIATLLQPLKLTQETTEQTDEYDDDDGGGGGQ